MNKLLNLAIIGGSIDSTIGPTHIKAINSTGKFNIYCGFFSRNNVLNIKSGKQYNVPKNRLYTNLKQLIKKEKKNIDIAVVLTPPNTRNKIFRDLINNNINIVSEKPLESNLKKAKEIFKIIQKKKIFFASTYNYLGYPGIIEIKSLVKNKIGKVLNFIIEMPQQTFVFKKSNIKKWRLKDKNKEIPNLYLDLASHLVSLIYYFFNEYPKELKNFVSKKNKFKVVDNSYVWLKFKKFYGSLWFSKNSAGQRNRLSIRIFGSKGSIEWNHNNPEKINFYDNNGGIEIIDRLNKKAWTLSLSGSPVPSHTFVSTVARSSFI